MYNNSRHRFKHQDAHGDEVVVTTTELGLPEILESFKHYLMACGFSINPSDELVLQPAEDLGLKVEEEDDEEEEIEE